MFVYRRGRKDELKVALTFDDGPNPPRTAEVLDVLAEAKVSATFFVIGKWVHAFPETLARVVHEGHVIGNHSYAHDRAICDFEEADCAIAAVTGKRSCFVRAPFLHHAALARWPPARDGRIKVIAGSVSSADYSLTAPQSIVDAVLQHPRLGAGSIIVLHDGSEDADRRLSRPLPMIQALPDIVNGLLGRGLTPVGLDNMTLVDGFECLE